MHVFSLEGLHPLVFHCVESPAKLIRGKWFPCFLLHLGFKEEHKFFFFFFMVFVCIFLMTLHPDLSRKIALPAEGGGFFDPKTCFRPPGFGFGAGTA